MFRKQANYYHLSEKNLDGKVLKPRVPKNFMTRHGYEDNKIPRISFAENIDGALTGIGSNLTNKEFFVHQPVEQPKIMSNEEVRKKVPDAHLSNEVWALEPVELKRTGKIKVTDSTSEPMPYQYGDMWADTYKWNWEDTMKKQAMINLGLQKLAGLKNALGKGLLTYYGAGMSDKKINENISLDHTEPRDEETVKKLIDYGEDLGITFKETDSSGRYYRDDQEIHYNPKKSPEATLAHEIGHHLNRNKIYGRSGSNHLFPLSGLYAGIEEFVPEDIKTPYKITTALTLAGNSVLPLANEYQASKKGKELLERFGKVTPEDEKLLRKALGTHAIPAATSLGALGINYATE